jgi:hypothetical protein
VAEIVGAFAVGHAPNAPGEVSRLGAGSEYAPLFAGVSEHLEAVDPDVIVMFDTDHFATFFYDNLPTFAVGIADHTSGPGTDRWPGLPSYDNIPVEESLARLVHKEGIEGVRPRRFTRIRRRPLDRRAAPLLESRDAPPDRADLDQRDRTTNSARKALFRPRHDGADGHRILAEGSPGRRRRERLDIRGHRWTEGAGPSAVRGS